MKNILCVIDIQKEYNTVGRPFHINEIEESLNNASAVLNHARKNNWDIIHVQHLQEGSIFSKNSPYAGFIEGFEPRENEVVCIKDNFSSFSSPEFRDALDGKENSQIYVLGYGSTMCCLSTIIDGYHRGYKFTFVTDASNAKPTKCLNSRKLHEAANEILQAFCSTKLTKEVL